ncbi:MAG: hypothetical protein KAX49_06280 [Halanaerobiales bacterium]|nr:hypothetical protein [Halanaerobiales bacterium]
MTDKVLVTGMSCISLYGDNVGFFWESLANGNLINKKIMNPGREKFVYGYLIEDFNVKDYVKYMGSRYLNEGSKMLLAAIDLAVRESQLDLEEELSERLGIVTGSNYEHAEIAVNFYSTAIKKSPRSVIPSRFPNAINNSSSGHGAIYVKGKAANLTISNGVTASLDAIGIGAQLIKSGRADIVLCCGVEKYAPYLLDGFVENKLVKTIGDLKPFNNEDYGFVLGEGAGVIVLESDKHAIKRGAKIYGEILGYSNGFQSKKSNRNNVNNIMNNAIIESGVKKIQAVFANANNLEFSDHLEAEAIKNLLDYYKIKYVSAIKGAFGECSAVDGIFQTILALKSLEKNSLLKSFYYSPESSIDQSLPITMEFTDCTLENILINGIDWNGNISSLVVSNSCVD